MVYCCQYCTRGWWWTWGDKDIILYTSTLCMSNNCLVHGITICLVTRPHLYCDVAINYLQSITICLFYCNKVMTRDQERSAPHGICYEYDSHFLGTLYTSYADLSWLIYHQIISMAKVVYTWPVKSLWRYDFGSGSTDSEIVKILFFAGSVFCWITNLSSLLGYVLHN